MVVSLLVDAPTRNTGRVSEFDIAPYNVVFPTLQTTFKVMIAKKRLCRRDTATYLSWECVMWMAVDFFYQVLVYVSQLWNVV